MALNKKDSGKASAMTIGILFGVLVSVLISLVSSSILAGLISGEKMSADAVGYGTAVILVVASSVGAWTANAKIKHHRTQVCLITGGVYFLVLLAFTAMLFDGQYRGLGISAICVLAGCTVVALLGIRDKKSRKSKFKKSAFC